MLHRILLPLSITLLTLHAPSARAQGQALLFDGVDDFALILDGNNDFDPGDSFTMEAWVRVDTPQSNAGVVVTNADTGLVAVAGAMAAAVIVTPVGAGSFSSAVAPAGSLATGTWNHHAGTYDGTTMRVYVNGGLRASNPVSGSAQDAAALLLGVRNQTNFFAGAIDEVRIWNDVRNNFEIRQSYDVELNGNEPGLVGYYKFEGTGQEVFDSSTAGNDGTLGLTLAVEPEDPQRTVSGVTFREEMIEEALRFDGIDDLCTILNPGGDFDLGAACTLEAWIRPDATNTGSGVVSAGGQQLLVDGSDASMVTTTQNAATAVAAQAFPQEQWKHVAGTYDGSAVRIYVAGVLQDTILQTGSGAGSGVALILGRLQSATGFFQGEMDEVSIWNVARSTSEIVDDARAGLTGTESGLVGYYKFNEGSGQVLVDSSSAGNNGFLGTSLSPEASDPVRITTGLSSTRNDPGGALRFDGVEDFCEVVDSFDDFDFGSSFTMEAWVRVDTPQPNAGVVVTDADSGLVGVAGTMSASVIATRVGTTNFVSSGGPGGTHIPGVWVHHAGSYDGTTVRLYVDGVLRSMNSNFAGAPVQAATLLRMGLRQTTSFFAGTLDEVRIWNVVRTPLEIERSAVCAPLPPQEGLVAYYKFDEALGQRILDSSGFLNHGWLGDSGAAAANDPERILSDAPACVAPANDLCTDAIDVSAGGTFTGTLLGASSEGPSGCSPATDSVDVWYSYTPTAVGNLTVRTCGTHDLGGVDEGVDTVLSLHRECGGSLIACNDDDAACSGMDQGLLRDSSVTVPVLTGQTVWIRVAHAAGGVEGAIQLEVSFEGGSFLNLCNGDGGDQMGCTNCPCGNNAPIGTIGGCINQSGTSARLMPSGSLSVSATRPADLSFDAIGGNAFTFAILVSGDGVGPLNPLSPCFGTNSGISGGAVLDGLRCVVTGIQRHGGRPMDANGAAGITTNGWGGPNGPMPNIATQGGFVPGQTRYFQVFYRADPMLSCQVGQNTTQAVGLTFEP